MGGVTSTSTDTTAPECDDTSGRELRDIESGEPPLGTSLSPPPPTKSTLGVSGVQDDDYPWFHIMQWGAESASGGCVVEWTLQDVKADIKSLTRDVDSFLFFCPHADIPNFTFDDSCTIFPEWAECLLKDLPSLRDVRFKLVPKKMKEDVFWHRYFTGIQKILAQRLNADEATTQHDSSNSVDERGNKEERIKHNDAEPSDILLAPPPPLASVTEERKQIGATVHRIREDRNTTKGDQQPQYFSSTASSPYSSIYNPSTVHPFGSGELDESS